MAITNFRILNPADKTKFYAVTCGEGAPTANDTLVTDILTYPVGSSYLDISSGTTYARATIGANPSDWLTVGGSGGGTPITVVDNLTSTSSTDALSANQGRVLNGRLVTAENNIATNTSDIQGLRNDFNNELHFQGYYQTNAEIEAITGIPAGSFAWSVESGSVWTYNGTTWSDSGVTVPDQTVQPSNTAPLVDSGSGNAGAAIVYARGDHRHPEDTTKANATDVYTKAETDTLLGALPKATIDTKNVTGSAVVTGVPTTAQIISVTYNRLSLPTTDYTFASGTVTITNTDITTDIEATDTVEVTYLINQ